MLYPNKTMQNFSRGKSALYAYTEVEGGESQCDGRYQRCRHQTLGVPFESRTLLIHDDCERAVYEAALCDFPDRWQLTVEDSQLLCFHNQFCVRAVGHRGRRVRLQSAFLHSTLDHQVWRQDARQSYGSRSLRSLPGDGRNLSY
jgi:hypothetical protein